jgi:hypothetical protein
MLRQEKTLRLAPFFKMYPDTALSLTEAGDRCSPMLNPLRKEEKPSKAIMNPRATMTRSLPSGPRANIQSTKRPLKQRKPSPSTSTEATDSVVSIGIGIHVTIKRSLDLVLATTRLRQGSEFYQVSYHSIPVSEIKVIAAGSIRYRRGSSA